MKMTMRLRFNILLLRVMLFIGFRVIELKAAYRLVCKLIHTPLAYLHHRTNEKK